MPQDLPLNNLKVPLFFHLQVPFFSLSWFGLPFHKNNDFLCVINCSYNIPHHSTIKHDIRNSNAEDRFWKSVFFRAWYLTHHVYITVTFTLLYFILIFVYWVFLNCWAILWRRTVYKEMIDICTSESFWTLVTSRGAFIHSSSKVIHVGRSERYQVSIINLNWSCVILGTTFSARNRKAQINVHTKVLKRDIEGCALSCPPPPERNGSNLHPFVGSRILYICFLLAHCLGSQLISLRLVGSYPEIKKSPTLCLQFIAPKGNRRTIQIVFYTRRYSELSLSSITTTPY